jgi:hypothetical protein
VLHSGKLRHVNISAKGQIGAYPLCGTCVFRIVLDVPGRNALAYWFAQLVTKKKVLNVDKRCHLKKYFFFGRIS